MPKGRDIHSANQMNTASKLIALCAALIVLSCAPVATPTTANDRIPPVAPASIASASPQAPAATPTATVFLPQVIASATPPSPSGERLQPSDLVYLGAFRLPDGPGRPQTFEYGGNAMTFNPTGDRSGPSDGFPGSLFVTGHDRQPYGELPDGSQVAEIDVPAPSLSRNVAELPQAEFVQGFHDVTTGQFTQMEEIVRIGMTYLDRPATGPLLHIAWGQHIEPDPAVATHGWFNLDLSQPEFHGPWFIAGQSWYSVNDYMFEIPAAWAEVNIGGRYLATGRFKDGGWSGMGPVLIAYRPWGENGPPPPTGSALQATALLRYADSTETANIERCLTGYQHPDEWNGGAWLTTGTGQSAVIFAGTKSNGTKYWYGYVNPAGPEYPCVDEEVLDFLTCRMADGSSCPPADFTECSGHGDYRGWWTTRWDSQIIFYDPADLARVAAGEMASWEPQPYAVLGIDESLFLSPAGPDLEGLGTGVQRRYRIGDVAYDRENGLLYLLELFADGAKPVVHVWRIEP